MWSLPWHIATKPDKRMNPTLLSRRIASGASWKLGLGSRKASRKAAARVMRSRWAAAYCHSTHFSHSL
jgi:hypothetical protein